MVVNVQCPGCKRTVPVTVDMSLPLTDESALRHTFSSIVRCTEQGSAGRCETVFAVKMVVTKQVEVGEIAWHSETPTMQGVLPTEGNTNGDDLPF